MPSMPHAPFRPPHLRLHCTALGVADLLSAACFQTALAIPVVVIIGLSGPFMPNR